jgi:glutaredoxin-like protein NrdH
MVTVYTLPSCVQCESTKKYLAKIDVPFQTIDLTEDAEAMDMIKGLGYQAAPVVIAGDAHWSGFRPDKLSALASN